MAVDELVSVEGSIYPFTVLSISGSLVSGYFADERACKFEWDEDILRVWRPYSFLGKAAYTFEGLKLLTENELALFFEKVNEACLLLSNLNKSVKHYQIKEHHLPLIRTVLNHEKYSGLLCFYLIQNIVEEFVTSSELLDQVLENQIPILINNVRTIGHLLPVIEHDTFFDHWLRYTNSPPENGTGLLSPVRERASYVENLIRLATFAAESLTNSKLTWGEVLDRPISFTKMGEFTALSNYLPLISLPGYGPEGMRSSGIRKMNLTQMKIYAHNRFNWSVSTDSAAIGYILSLSENYISKNHISVYFEIFLKFEEDLKKFEEVFSNEGISEDVRYWYHVKFASAYIMTKFGVDALVDFIYCCKIYLEMNDNYSIERAFVDDMVQMFESGIAQEMSLEMAINIEKPHWFEQRELG